MTLRSLNLILTLTALSLAGAVLWIGSTQTVSAQNPAFYSFGGRIVAVTPCPATGGTWSAVSLPRPGAFVYTPGATTSFSYGPPLVNGQSLLGQSLPTPVACTPTPAGPFGLPIVYHGASLPGAF